MIDGSQPQTQTTTLDYASPAQLPARRWSPAQLRHAMLECVLGIVCVALAFLADGFFSTDNLLAVLRAVSMQGVIALGMTLVIIAGEIDLSVGSAVAFAGCVAAWVVQACHDHLPWLPPAAAVALGMAAAMLVGTLIGVASGWLRVRFGVPTFISTLAWMTVLRGAAQLVTGGFPLRPFPAWFEFLGGGTWRGVPAIIFLLVFALVYFVANHTLFGRAVYAVGGNVEAARLSGISVLRVKVAVMGLVGLLSALAGLMVASQIMSGNATTATGWELDVISAVIIGGTSLAGGAGSVWRTLVGIIFLGVLVNGMTLLNIKEDWQLVVRGALIFAAVLMNVTAGKKVQRG